MTFYLPAKYRSSRRATCHLIALFCMLLAGCDTTFGSDGDETLSVTQLKYTLDTRYTIFFCDPDYWPIVRGDEQERALERFPAIAADTSKLNAILEHLGLTGRTDFTAGEKLKIYREDKRLAAITVDSARTPFQFQLRATQGQSVVAISGEIERNGRIVVRQQTQSSGACPICLSGNTRIYTAEGTIAVRALVPGMKVWTLDARNQRVLVPILRTMRVAAPPGHQFIRLRLADGRELLASPGHPTADGRRLSEISTGDFVDGARVLEVARVSADESTFDLLPDGSAGVYWANGILLGSTLKK